MISNAITNAISTFARTLLTVVLVIATVFAQSATSSKSAEEKKAREERDKKALALVDEIIREIEALKLPENRVRMDVALADSLWPRDEKRARSLFKQAVASLGEITVAAAAEGQDRDYVAQLSQQLRQEILQVATNHDAGLALEFLRATRPASAWQQSYWQPSAEAQLEMRVAMQVVAKDPKGALLVGQESLKLGLGQEAANLLYSFSAQDKPAAETFLNDIMKQLRSGESSKSQAAPYIALTLLRSWFETNRAASDPSAERLTASPATLTVDIARELSGMIINEVLNSGSTDAPNELHSISLDGRSPGYYPGQLLGLIQQIKPMLPDIEKLSPTQFSALNTRIAEFDKFNESRQGAWAKYQKLAETGTAAELVQAAKTAPAAVSEGLLQRAAWKAIGQEDAAAHEFIEKIADPRQRAEMEMNMVRRSFERAQSERKLADARSSLSRLPTEEHAMLLAQMASSFASDGNKATALELLGEAESLLGNRAMNYQQLRARLQIAGAYGELNPGKSAGLVEMAINQINELAVAALVLNGFDLQQYFRNGELVIGNGNGLTEMAQESAQKLGSLARHDFDRAKSAAEEFQRPEMRIMALLQIAQAALARDDD